MPLYGGISMKNVELADDVYEYLRRQQSTFSESVSEVLRRLFKLNPEVPHDPRAQKPSLPPDAWKRWNLQETKDEIQEDERKKAAWEFLHGPQFRSERTAVGKFLSLLAFLHRENKEKFVGILGINGRTRKYFAKTESELEQSGNSVHPKNIPGSGYWVVTNNSTQSKCELLLQVCRLLGYDDGFAAFIATHVK
jgi:negative modulator of initiation of replication